jgi:hypothetical protein
MLGGPRLYEFILRIARMPIAARISINAICPRTSSVGTTTPPGRGVGVGAGGDVGVGVAGGDVGVGVGVPGGDVGVAVGVGGAPPVVIPTKRGMLNPVAAPCRVRSGATFPFAVRA